MTMDGGITTGVLKVASSAMIKNMSKSNLKKKERVYFSL